MQAIERRQKILEKLQKEKWVNVSELSRQFHVSEETIRRDLERFETQGLIIKSYGGAVWKDAIPAEIPFKMRKRQNMEGKLQIGEMLCELIEDGDHILLDPSTTALSIVKALRRAEKKNLTIITNSLEVLVDCAEDSNWKLISTGGMLQADKYALVGPQALSAISSYHVDKAIISCKGLDIENGLTDVNDMFSQVKQTMLANASKKILAADYTKFDKVAFSKICNISDIDLLVTDLMPAPVWLEVLSDKGIECLYGQDEDQSISV